MGGITNYYHGESGLVADCQRLSGDDQTAHVIRLLDDPHREYAYDYGGDVHIDPLIQTGDRAIFVRLDTYGGIWVREDSQFFPDLQAGIERTIERRIREGLDPSHIVRVHGVWSDQCVSNPVRQLTGSRNDDRPATDVSFFLSFSSANVLLARQVYADLKDDVRVEVWFDLNQGGETPSHKEHTERWLKNAVYSRRGFILMWTNAAASSEWVTKEIAWALGRATGDPLFRFIVLKLDDTPLPSSLAGPVSIIDCYDLWPVNGINEELFAAVLARTGRIVWRDEHRSRSVILSPDEGSSGYEPFRSESGTAAGLRHWSQDGELHWELEYTTPSGAKKIAVGSGRAQAVDLDIRPGDYIGSYICHRSALVRFWPGIPLWMRSADLDVRPEDVLPKYLQSSRAAYLRSGGGNLSLGLFFRQWVYDVANGEIATRPRMIH